MDDVKRRQTAHAAAVMRLSWEAEYAAGKYRALTRFGRPSPLVGACVAATLTGWAAADRQGVLIALSLLMWAGTIASFLSNRWIRQMGSGGE